MVMRKGQLTNRGQEKLLIRLMEALEQTHVQDTVSYYTNYFSDQFKYPPV